MNTIITNNSSEELSQLIAPFHSDNIFILTDTNTHSSCLPHLLKMEALKDAKVMVIESGDEHKNLETATEIWKFLVENMANRHSLMINLGGGMVTDIGGFCASTFKRGINYINIATSLLGAVDAATGGKVGINFMGYKNEVGAFSPALATVIDVFYFRTLDRQNIISGYAEMIKHALIYDSEQLTRLCQFNFDNIDYELLKNLLTDNIKVKEEIVSRDPKELGIRKALNFGHTIGHAIESYKMHQQTPVLHGYAVAWGMICELFLSVKYKNFPKEEYLKIKSYLLLNYGYAKIDSSSFGEIMDLMKHDKKNRNRNEINFTLLSSVGGIEIDEQVSNQHILESFAEILE